jgi:uncharacterized protein YxjI
MPKILSIANTLLSVRGRMQITDERGSSIYEAKGELALLSPTWRISRSEQEVATVRRKILSWPPTWMVHCGLDDFLIKRKLLSWTRQYYARGGPYDGALIKGSLWDMSFEVLHGVNTVAVATAKILSLRDRHNIEIFGKEERDELFVVVAMVVLHLDRREARRES